jgi:hypothetical protein
MSRLNTLFFALETPVSGLLLGLLPGLLLRRART